MLKPDGAPFTYGNGAQGFRNGPFVAWGARAGSSLSALAGAGARRPRISRALP